LNVNQPRCMPSVSKADLKKDEKLKQEAIRKEKDEK
jgi:hypothetical protein